MATLIRTKPTYKEEWFGSLKKAKEDRKKKEALRRQHKIQRVAKVLREKNQDCFGPIAVSIGPYHRHKPHLQRMEKLKAPMLWQYVEAQNCPMEELYHEVEKVAAKARECYAEDVTKGMSDEDFTRMMFLDGCFFLQFITCGREGIQMSRSDRDCVVRDLFLLENQLPFIVLKALSGSSDPVQKMMDFIKCGLSCNPQRKKERSKAEREKEQSKTEGEPIHLLQLLRQSLLNPEDLQGKRSRNSALTGFDAAAGHTYGSATELKKVGIYFRMSQSPRFTDVGFRNNLGLLRIQGELRLPPMYVGDHTRSHLLNVVAYEMCADVPEEASFVTSYLGFLDALIDSAEDVKELRSNGILINYLGSDQQVADLFNQIGDGLGRNPLAYARVNEQIEEHYTNKFKRWIWEMLQARMYTYFKAPWSLLSFFAALIILLLTFIQALYAVKAFYAPNHG